MGPAIAIGANIYRHRKEAHQAQDDLARHLGVTKASVSKWETGQSYPDIETLYSQNPAKINVSHERARAIIDAFGLESVYANTAAIHLSFAMAYTMSGHADRALDCLDDYVQAVRALSFPIELHGDAFLDKTQPWLEDINAIGASAPRDDVFVKRNLVESVAANPAFEPLWDEPRCKRIIEGLGEVAR